MDRIGTPTATAASAADGLRHDTAVTGFPTGGRADPPVSRAVQGDHRHPGVRDRESGDISEFLSAVGRVRGTGCMDLHPRDRA